MARVEALCGYGGEDHCPFLCLSFWKMLNRLTAQRSVVAGGFEDRPARGAALTLWPPGSDCGTLGTGIPSH
jgi:hypothetical protein